MKTCYEMIFTSKISNLLIDAEAQKIGNMQQTPISHEELEKEIVGDIQLPISPENTYYASCMDSNNGNCCGGQTLITGNAVIIKLSPRKRVENNNNHSNPYELPRWFCLKKSKEICNRFIFLLSPILETIYQTIQKKINSSELITNITREFDLERWMRVDLAKIFTPMISRACVIELHYAKKKIKLLGATQRKDLNLILRC